jgi:hypothetical protein
MIYIIWANIVIQKKLANIYAGTWFKLHEWFPFAPVIVKDDLKCVMIRKVLFRYIQSHAKSRNILFIDNPTVSRLYRLITRQKPTGEYSLVSKVLPVRTETYGNLSIMHEGMRIVLCDQLLLSEFNLCHPASVGAAVIYYGKNA